MKMKKTVKRIVLATMALLCLGFLFVCLVLLTSPSEISSLEQIDDNELHTVALGGQTLCSDGSPFSIFVRKGKSNNLIIHFSGGGACWDGKTCASPITMMSLLSRDPQLKSYYVPRIYKFIPKLITGLPDNHESNPFKDWSVVYIPYCTGDFHVGNVTNVYQYDNREFEIHHNGRNNSIAALQWTFSNFKSPDKIMVSGESAGGFASAFWAPVVANHYSSKKIHQLADASMLNSTRWNEIMDTVWKAESATYLNFKIRDDVYEDALLGRSDSLNYRINHLHSNTVFDGVLSQFSAALNHQPTTTIDYIDDWSTNMLHSMKKLSESGLDYEYFISDCQYDSKTHSTPHMLSGLNYNSCDTGPISFSEWLKKNVIDDEPLSLGIHLLDKLK
ncbi:MAG TPA: hypothetical protein DIS90_07925 [Cytophagales bacterium]|nr:hypothetical protein [Cytophagales bacterium]